MRSNEKYMKIPLGTSSTQPQNETGGLADRGHAKGVQICTQARTRQTQFCSRARNNSIAGMPLPKRLPGNPTPFYRIDLNACEQTFHNFHLHTLRAQLSLPTFNTRIVRQVAKIPHNPDATTPIVALLWRRLKVSSTPSKESGSVDSR